MADQEFLASSMRASDARQDPGEERSVRIREKNGLDRLAVFFLSYLQRTGRTEL